MQVGVIRSVKGANRTKRQRKDIVALFFLLELGHLSSWTSVCLAVRPSDSACIVPPALLGLQLADGRSWDLAACSSIFKICWFRFSGEPQLINAYVNCISIQSRRRRKKKRRVTGTQGRNRPELKTYFEDGLRSRTERGRPWPCVSPCFPQTYCWEKSSSSSHGLLAPSSELLSQWREPPALGFRESQVLTPPFHSSLAGCPFIGLPSPDLWMDWGR